MIAGIVLAAGFGERFGRPKALVELALHRRPLVALHAERMLEVGCAKVLVVVRENVAKRLPVLGNGVQIVISDGVDQAASLAVAARALHGEPVEAVFVSPVDMPPVRGSTLACLLRALEMREDWLAVSPTFRKRGGHPTLCRRSVLSEYLTPQPSFPPLREVLRALGERRGRIEVDDETVCLDFDVAMDLTAWEDRHLRDT